MAAVATAVCAALVAGPTHPGDAAAAAPAQVTDRPPTVGDALPAYPLRTVPGVVQANAWRARTAGGAGAPDFVASIPTGTGSTPLYGDWDGNGTFTPGYFLNGVWVMYDRIVGRPVAWRTFTYGRTGDAAVAGDWNRDGRTDIGVFRNGTWYQRDAPSAGPSTRTFVYGTRGDRPLAGDWDGNGGDTIGVHRGNVFYLRDTNSSGVSHHRRAFGRSSDSPVVGDWNGDRTDTVGVARGATWFLSSGHAADSSTAQVTLTSSATGRPLPYPSPAGAGGGACPTIVPGLAVPTDTYVRAPAGLDAPMPDGPLRDAFLDAGRTILGVEYGTDYASRNAHTYLNLLAVDPSAELAIRGASMSALTVAVAVSMDGYDGAVIGRPRSQAIDYVDWLVRSAACQHDSLSPRGWGRTWQSALWAGQLGLAAWLVWDELAPQTRAYVAHVVAAEADAVTARPVPYWRNRDGVVLPGRTGNSAAEEAAWDAGHLGLATQMLAGHPRATAWSRAGVQLGVAAYATEADTRSTRPINGIPLRTRLGGFNAYDDGTVENHGGIHADYISVAQYAWWSRIYAGLADRPVPEAYTHNGRLVWRAVTALTFPAPPFEPPAGTIYRPDGSIHYPAVADWGQLRYPQWMAFDATATLVAADVDPATGAADVPSAIDWLDLHTARTRDLQVRHADGHIYEPGEERYARAEELNAQLIALAWAARYTALHLPDAQVTTALVPLP